MKKTLSCLLLVAACCALPADQGTLVIIGGGPRPDYLIEYVIKQAGGPEQLIAIIPAASEDPLDSALYARHQFESCGARNVRFLLLEPGNVDLPENLETIEKARAVYFCGGDQNRLLEILRSTRLLEAIRAVYSGGGVVSGTSAGAAVMSGIMITGTENPPVERDEDAFRSIRQNTVNSTAGFAFLTEVIIDQHFVRRKRHNRLISLVLENPGKPGIGIDEETAAIIRPDGLLEVMGENLVMIYDARQAELTGPDQRGNLSVMNLKVHLLRHGMVFDLRGGRMAN